MTMGSEVWIIGLIEKHASGLSKAGKKLPEAPAIPHVFNTQAGYL